MRYPIIDGFRGFFLLFMMTSHLNAILDTKVGRLNFNSLGSVESAQGFVFISGFVVGLVYGGLLLRRSHEAMRTAILGRMRTIWSHQAGLILLFLATAFLLPLSGLAPAVFAPYRAEPAAFTIASLMLVSASMHMGILPMYIWFMAVTPLVLTAIASGRGPALFLISALLWLVAQTGLTDVATMRLEGVLADAGHPISLGIYFDLFGWQVLFFGGLWLGFLTAQGWLDLSFLKGAGWTAAAAVAAIGVAGFALLDRLVYWDWISPEFTSVFLDKFPRQDFSAVHLLNFAVDLFLVTWLLVAGRESGSRIFAGAAAAIHWLFTRPALVFLGQHSLHVFSFHIAVVYVAAVVFEAGPPDELTGTLLLIAGAASLWLAAWAHAQMQQAARRRALATATGS